jgi:hypothetical protein
MSDIDKLRAFAQDILEGWPEVPQWDGLDLQEIATKHGLLESKTVTESCGEGCNCVEYDDFPMQCFRPSKLLKGDSSGQETKACTCHPLRVLDHFEGCPALETSSAQCDHSWITSNFEAPRCLWCHVEKSAAETSPAQPFTPQPVKTWEPDDNGLCKHCVLTWMLHIAQDEHGRANVCAPISPPANR